MGEKMSIIKSENIVWQNSKVTRPDRECFAGHKSYLIWFTGLSGSGKSTLAQCIEKKLFESGLRTIILDGDNIRHGLCSDLGFSNEDRTENIRRVGELSKLFLEAGVITIAAFISPIEQDRLFVKNLVGENDFLDIYCQCDLDICVSRDVKGLYKKVRDGEIKNFTGIDMNYELPIAPFMTCNTGFFSVDECVNQIIEKLASRGLLKHS